MKRVKSLIFTLLVSGIIFGILHFIPIEIGSKEKKESNFPIVRFSRRKKRYSST